MIKLFDFLFRRKTNNKEIKYVTWDDVVQYFKNQGWNRYYDFHPDDYYFQNDNFSHYIISVWHLWNNHCCTKVLYLQPDYSYRYIKSFDGSPYQTLDKTIQFLKGQ